MLLYMVSARQHAISQYSKPDQIQATKEGERVSAPSHYLTERPPPALVRGSGARHHPGISGSSGDAVGVSRLSSRPVMVC